MTTERKEENLGVPQEKETNQQPEGMQASQSPEEEYNAAWEEATVQTEGESDADVEARHGVHSPQPAPETGKSSTFGSIESMEKALKDTQSYAGKLQAEVAELRKKLEAFERGEATAKDVSDQAAATKKAQDDLDKITESIYEDYPELQPLIETIIQKIQRIESVQQARERDAEEIARMKALDEFNRNVKPKIMQVHSDFDEIVRSESYWKWAEAQSPALRYAAMDSPAPEDIIWAISEYKKSLGVQKDVSRINRVAHLQTLRGGSTSIPTRVSANNAGDYDAGWREADVVLKKEGLL